MADNFELFENQTANGTSHSITLNGGQRNLYAEGTFDGGTVTIQAKFNDEWITLLDSDGNTVEITAADIFVIDYLAVGTLLQVTLSGAGAGTDINVGIR